MTITIILYTKTTTATTNVTTKLCVFNIQMYVKLYLNIKGYIIFNILHHIKSILHMHTFLKTKKEKEKKKKKKRRKKKKRKKIKGKKRKKRKGKRQLT